MINEEWRGKKTHTNLSLICNAYYWHLALKTINILNGKNLWVKTYRWLSDQHWHLKNKIESHFSFFFLVVFCFQIELPRHVTKRNQRTPFVSCWSLACLAVYSLSFSLSHSGPFFFFHHWMGFSKKRPGYFDNKLNEFHDEWDELNIFSLFKSSHPPCGQRLIETTRGVRTRIIPQERRMQQSNIPQHSLHSL